MKNTLKRSMAAFAVLCMTWPVLSPVYALRESRPPEDVGKPWLQWIITLAMTVACVAIAFKNAKRSHQD